MSKYLQQREMRSQATDHKVCTVGRYVPLKANYALLLVLVIIPNLSGVALIA
jgi:hypothetical protein